MTDDLADALPNCPRCLHPLDVRGDDPERPSWWCPVCRVATLALGATR